MIPLVRVTMVSFAAVIRVVTQRFSPREKRYVTTLITAAPLRSTRESLTGLAKKTIYTDNSSNGPCTAPEMIPTPKWSQPWNDPQIDPEMIPTFLLVDLEMILKELGIGD